MKSEENKKSRRKRTEKQIELLYTIYKFRFVTVDLLAMYLGITQGTAQIRLNLLVRETYIGRLYDSTYRLRGKGARYMLLPNGFNELKRHRELSPTIIKQLYKDPYASEAFADRQVTVMEVALTLINNHNVDNDKFLTKSEMIKYSGLPDYPPDGFFASATKKSQNFFIDVVTEQEPLFVSLRKVREYIDFGETSEWEESGRPVPILLLIFETEPSLKRVGKKVRQLVYSVGTEIMFGMTTLARLKTERSLRLISNDEDEPLLIKW